MLIKEYRIPLPLSVEEYRIAQLYMIAKKSREESEGTGSGIEIIINEPYDNGPGGKGQYTHKIYHVGNHLPVWFKSLLPKSALTVEEEAWNAYPYTKTRYTCPFVQRFSLEIETYYCQDSGDQENIFELSDAELRNRIVDLIDVTKDQSGADYCLAEDPLIYVSKKTNRGPLTENWIEKARNKNNQKNGNVIMCAYKLCRVEFNYWGMQSKIEKFIHDIALRKTMIRAHRQAWAWQDEWSGLTMVDIRRLEKETQEALRQKMRESINSRNEESVPQSAESLINEEESTIAVFHESPHQTHSPNISNLNQQRIERERERKSKSPDEKPMSPSHQHFRTKAGSLSNSNISTLEYLRMEGLTGNDTSAEEEFFDCFEGDEDDLISLHKWSSLDLIPQEEILNLKISTKKGESQFEYPGDSLLIGASSTNISPNILISNDDTVNDNEQNPDDGNESSTKILILVIHAGSALDSSSETTSKNSDVMTFKTAFENVVRHHYPVLSSKISIRLVPCPSPCSDTLGILSSLNPFSRDLAGKTELADSTYHALPIGTIPLFATFQKNYGKNVKKTVMMANMVYEEFLRSDEGQGFKGQIVFVGDSMGSLLAYEALKKYSYERKRSSTSIDEECQLPEGLLDSTSTGTSKESSLPEPTSSCLRFIFEVSEFFMFGSPLGLVLTYRILKENQLELPKPCKQVYNLFHMTDPLATRIEPLISADFAAAAPAHIERYSKYPFGDGKSLQLMDFLHENQNLLSPETIGSSGGLSNQGQTHQRKLSDISVESTTSGVADAPLLTLEEINTLRRKWWGTKRIDYALYCPEGLANFPINSLPHLFHSSYWESFDAIAFIIRQIGYKEMNMFINYNPNQSISFCPTPFNQKEKWKKKRTSVKLKNLGSNHRGNDMIVMIGNAQVLKGRFMYGPIDMVALTGEKVDVYAMKDIASEQWDLLTCEISDKNGRVSVVIPPEQRFPCGIFPIKMVVRGDKTCCDFYLAVVPPKTECVVFSIDGSFTSSFTVTAKDPRVRPGAVDVVRYWYELGYLILYITGRPDMQKHKVVSWLAQHNFPYGIIAFSDGLSADFLGHKADYLRGLVQDQQLCIHAAYGSQKDIPVYNSIPTIVPERIYIIGKVSKKLFSRATVLVDGYSSHLTDLQNKSPTRPSQVNNRMVMPRVYFNEFRHSTLRSTSNSNVK